jgi:hypothetical protein
MWIRSTRQRPPRQRLSSNALRGDDPAAVSGECGGYLKLLRIGHYESKQGIQLPPQDHMRYLGIKNPRMIFALM